MKLAGICTVCSVVIVPKQRQKKRLTTEMPRLEGKLYRLLAGKEGGIMESGYMSRPSICFVGPYRPVICGIADYTAYLTRVSPVDQWVVISFNLHKYGGIAASDSEMPMGPVWYGIPDRHSFSATAIRAGLRELGMEKDGTVLWFQHEFGIWPDNLRFITMLRNLKIPKVVTFHTLHFQSPETDIGLRREQYSFLELLLPNVDAITVFSHGVYQAVTSAFPVYRGKVHVIKHGIHSYPDVSRLTRREAKEKLNEYLLLDSSLDLEAKRALHKERVLSDPNTAVIGQTGFLSPAKGSELLFSTRDMLQEIMPQKRIAAVRIGYSRDEIQQAYAEKLRDSQKGKPGFILNVWLPQNILPLAQRAFDINFYWPIECTQSGVLAHALGAGAIVAGRSFEGVGEMLKESGQPVDADLHGLLRKIQKIIENPELVDVIEEKANNYTTEYSWVNQVRRHYELATLVQSRALRLYSHDPFTSAGVSV